MDFALAIGLIFINFMVIGVVVDNFRYKLYGGAFSGIGVVLVNMYLIYDLLSR